LGYDEFNTLDEGRFVKWTHIKQRA
jgi:hypothetical protein